VPIHACCIGGGKQPLLDRRQDALKQVLAVSRVIQVDIMDKLEPPVKRAEKLRKRQENKSRRQVEEEDAEEKEVGEGSVDGLPEVDWDRVCGTQTPPPNTSAPPVRFNITGGAPCTSGEGLWSFSQQKLTLTSDGNKFTVLFDSLKTFQMQVPSCL
jgi:hypothetical protein